MSLNMPRFFARMAVTLLVPAVLFSSSPASHLCTQMPLPERQWDRAHKLATELNPANALRRSPQSGAMPYSSKWPRGATLRVRLLGGSAVLRSKVQKTALQWNDVSGVKIQFVKEGPAEIRVSFNPDGTSWSYVGTDCLSVADDQPTMNYGWLTDETADDEYSRVVLHEFGHALGLIHEHQSPVAGIPWDKEKVYAYYQHSDGWSREKVDENIFRLYAKDSTQYSSFDKDSIMLYAIPADLTTNGYSVGWNRALSTTDKQFVARIYPPETPASPNVRVKVSAAKRPASSTAARGETGFEANGPVVKSAPVLVRFGGPSAMSAPRASLPVPSGVSVPPALPPLSEGGERTGKLANYIRNNPSVRKAQQLKSDPRVGRLSQAVRADFLNEYGVLMFSAVVPSRDSLLTRVHNLDKDQMEMEDRTFKYQEDVTDYNRDEAVYEAHVREQKGGVDKYTSDQKAYANDLASYEARLADYNTRHNPYEADVAAHNAEVAQYSQQCLGGPLDPGPYAQCMSWQQSLSSRKSALDTRKASLDAEKGTLDQTRSILNALLSALQKRAAELNARKAELDADLKALQTRFDALTAEKKKLEDWSRLIQPQWDFEIKQIDDWRSKLDNFNDRLDKALAQVKAPIPGAQEKK